MSIGKVISEWRVKETSVFLYQNVNCFAFSTDGRAGKTSTFKPTLYDMIYAVNLVKMFQRTIGENLSREEAHSSCFLPKLCIAAHNGPGIQVALFGRVDANKIVTGELKGLRWGVLNTATNEEQSFDASDTVVEAFLRHAPNSNRSHILSVKNANGDIVEKEADDHYAMNQYVKRFSVELIRDENNHIKNIKLHHVSLLDKNIFLDEGNWAVTLVSSMVSSSSFFSRLFEKTYGHAMLACEGVDQGKSFLRYVHFTQSSKDESSNLASDEGLIESFEPKSPLTTKNGPTWLRTKIAVENMFQYVETMKRKPLKFCVYREYGAIQTKGWKMVMDAYKHRKTEYDNNRDNEALEIYRKNYPNINTIPMHFSFSLGMLNSQWNKMEDEEQAKMMIQQGKEVSDIEFFKDITKTINQSILLFEDLRKKDLAIDQMPSNCLSIAMHIAQYAGIIFLRTKQLRTPLEKIDILNQRPAFLLPINFDRSRLGTPLGSSEEEKILCKGIVDACVMLTAEDTPPEEFYLWERQWIIQTTQVIMKPWFEYLKMMKWVGEAAGEDNFFSNYRKKISEVLSYLPSKNYLLEF